MINSPNGGGGRSPDEDWNYPNYKMNHKNRGFALIFNFVDFHPYLGLKRRNGSDADVRALQAVLPELGFTVPQLGCNMTKEQVDAEIAKYAILDHSDSDCIMLIFLTHGDGKYIYTSDERMEYKKVWEAFNTRSCPSLANKPKIFILQACHKKIEQPAAFLPLKNLPLLAPTEPFVREQYFLPMYSDFILMFSTIPGFCSFRHPTEGSLYIQSLCEAFLKYNELDIHGMAAYTSRQVCYKYGNYYEHYQQPNTRQSLCRNIWFKRDPPAI